MNYRFILNISVMIRKQLLVLLLLLLVVVFVFWVFYGLFSTFFRRDTSAMYVPSFDRHIRLMRDQLKLVSGKKLVDLWCGDGKAMRFFSRTFHVLCDGYEIQHFPYVYGKLLNRILGYPQLRLFKKNFLQADIHVYDYIYVYLLPEQMAAIEDWIFSHIKNDAIIISNSFQFAKHKPYDTIPNKHGKPSIFLYRKS